MPRNPHLPETFSDPSRSERRLANRVLSFLHRQRCLAVCDRHSASRGRDRSVFRRSRLLSFGLLVFVLCYTHLVRNPYKGCFCPKEEMYVPIIGLILALAAILDRYRLEPAVLKVGSIGVLEPRGDPDVSKEVRCGQMTAFFGRTFSKKILGTSAHTSILRIATCGSAGSRRRSRRMTCLTRRTA